MYKTCFFFSSAEEHNLNSGTVPEDKMLKKVFVIAKVDEIGGGIYGTVKSLIG